MVIPEYVIVHDGDPEDPTARNYWVRYKDYIKNVASSEIYPTWSESAIYANILVIQSFTLNRVFTEWYRGKGYDFTITSSTAYDQKWIYGRNVFERDRLSGRFHFYQLFIKTCVRQPIFTSYCDGNRTTCRGLSQWGSSVVGGAGDIPPLILFIIITVMICTSILRILYRECRPPGRDMTWTIGASGEKVRQLQQQLNRIARNYPAIPT